MDRTIQSKPQALHMTQVQLTYSVARRGRLSLRLEAGPTFQAFLAQLMLEVNICLHGILKRGLDRSH